MRKIIWLALLFAVQLQAQCFDCNKHIGGHNGDGSADIERTTDGLVYLINSGNTISGYINKYDFNCNLMWSKTFTNSNVLLMSVSSDSDGNIYLLIQNTTSTNAGLGPWNVNGFMMCPGMNFYKLDPQGNIIWTRYIGPRTATRLQNIKCSGNTLYITGSFYDNLTIGGTVSFSHSYTDYARAFIAKYDTNGNFIDAIEYGNGMETFGLSEVDPQGNVYLTYKSMNHEYSKLDKFNSDLNLVWSNTLTQGSNSTGIYHPNSMRFNTENQKLYVWGGMNLDVNIMGNPFFISTNNGAFQIALTEFDTSTGALTNIRRFDNNSNYNVPPLNGLYMIKRAYMVEKNGYLYVLTSFTEILAFPNGTVTSQTYFNGNYYSEELVLFKVKLADFTPELIFQSHGMPNLSYFVADHPGDIVFNGNDLYLTASYSSKPIEINGSIIGNNSGNNATDALLYKFNIFNLASSGSIVAEHTCPNDQTEFNLAGNYDSVSWDFGEPASANNTSTATNPHHQYAGSGTYHVTAVVTCGADTQTVETDVNITPAPVLNAIAPLTACENINGSGISPSFDTSQLHTMLVGAQPNVTLAYLTTNGNLLPSPLPNPFTNITANSQTVVVRAYFTQNPTCYSQGNIVFNTMQTPNAPTADAQQAFCTGQDATIADLVAAESGVVWYDDPDAGNVVAATTALVNGTTYYGALNNGTCESPRTPVTVNIQNSPAPTGSANQTFCALANPTLAEVAVSGDAVVWYDAAGGSVLPVSTTLIDGTTYYATQTVNGCESLSYLAVTFMVQQTLNATDYAAAFCDIGDNQVEPVDLSSFQAELIADPQDYDFAYFNTLADAQNATSPIGTGFQLPLGSHVLFVRITSATGCHQIVKLSLKLFESPRVAIEDQIPLCKNVGHLTISAGIFNSYLWSTGATSSSISVTQPGMYWVTVTQNHPAINCSSTKNFNVYLSDVAAILGVDIQEWTTQDNALAVQVDVSGDFEYSLDGVNYQSSNTFTGLPPGLYTIFVRDLDGCGVTRTEVVVLMYPKYFTPNGDGVNDSWQIRFAEIEHLDVRIFDRYGKLLANLKRGQAWDGNFNGQTLPASDYWFVVTKADGSQCRGHFSLIR